MSQVLYRKYRPKTFEEVEGQEHVVRTLRGALTSGRIGHAYLFAGPRGTGKTTMARLLAKALNCANFSKVSKTNIEPCNSCHSCTEINEGRSLDLIEIDAASNRGIDEIRNLKDSARVAATSSVHKVFIIDEVHMLTSPAFNALLKILEEPPSHVIFILATTEAYKIPDTVLSRVQRFDFKKISSSQIQTKLAAIAKKEKLNMGDQALAMIASGASGSLRDAESALGKLIAYSGKPEITVDDVAQSLGIVPSQVHENLVNLIINKNSQAALILISDLHESGADLNNFTGQFIRHLRASLIDTIHASSGHAVAEALAVPGKLTPEVLIKIINTFVEASGKLKYSAIPQLPLELAVLELTK